MIAIRRSVGGVSGRDFPSPLRRLLVCLGITPPICPPHRPAKNAYVERFPRTYGQECLQVHRPSTLKAGTRGDRDVSPALQRRTSPSGTLLWECPASCGLSNLAHRTRPRHLRVDPDAWLVPLDQKVYLRHVGRDGCVDIDLATYYLGPQMAGWSVLFQVEAQSRQFAVWHQDQVVKLLPVPRLARPGDGPGRLSAVHPARGVGCSATCFCPSGKTTSDSRLFGGRELDFVLHPPAFSGACSAFEQRAGKLLSPGFGKGQGNQEQSAARAALASDRTCMLLTPCFFLSSLSFSQFNLSRFDEPTQAEVTMTESRTRCASRGMIPLWMIKNSVSGTLVHDHKQSFS